MNLTVITAHSKQQQLKLCFTVMCVCLCVLKIMSECKWLISVYTPLLSVCDLIASDGNTAGSFFASFIEIFGINSYFNLYELLMPLLCRALHFLTLFVWIKTECLFYLISHIHISLSLSLYLLLFLPTWHLVLTYYLLKEKRRCFVKIYLYLFYGFLVNLTEFSLVIVPCFRVSN